MWAAFPVGLFLFRLPLLLVGVAAIGPTLRQRCSQPRTAWGVLAGALLILVGSLASLAEVWLPFALVASTCPFVQIIVILGTFDLGVSPLQAVGTGLLVWAALSRRADG